MRWDTTLFIAGLGLGVAMHAHAAEKRVKQSELPAPVQKAVQEQSKGATIKGYSKDLEAGQVEYEVEMIVDGHSKDVSMAADGRILEIEEQIEMKELPTSVQKALTSKARSREIAKVESITKAGRLVAYEAQLKGMGRPREIQVGPDGGALTHQE